MLETFLGYVKLNANFTCYEDGGGGLGVILHDRNRCVIMLGSKWLSIIGEIVEGEALVILWGLQMAINDGHGMLEVESDNF